MQRKFLTSLFLIVLLNLLVKPFYILGIDAEVQNRVGEEMYGNYFALLNFSFLLNILLDLGITNYNTRNIAQHPQLLEKHFFKILSLRISLFVLYATCTLVFGFVVGFGRYESYLLGLLMINQFLVAIIQFSRSNFAGLHLFKTDAVISILDRSLLIIFCAALLWGNVLGDQFKIEWFIYAQTLAYGITALIALGMLTNRIGGIKLKIKKNFSAAILKQSFPYALLIFLMMMYNRVDAVMLERLLLSGDEQAGVYAQGFRFLDAVNMFALLFAGLLLPIFSRLIKQKESVKDMMEMAFKILMVVSITAGLIGFWFQQEIMEWRYDDISRLSPMTFGFLILSFIPVSITYVFGTLLTANGSLKALNKMAVFGVVLNISLNLAMIDSLWAMGAAIATLVTQWVMAIIQIILVYHTFKIKINWGMYTKVIAFASVLVGLLYVLQFKELSIDVWMRLMITIGFSPILALILGLLKPREIITILKKED